MEPMNYLTVRQFCTQLFARRPDRRIAITFVAVMHRGDYRPLLLSVSFLVAIVIVICSTSGCGSRYEAPIYRIGLGPWIGFGPFYLAEEMGFFKEAGVRVQPIVITGIAERNSALKSGRIDALAAPVDYFVLSAGNRLQTTMVMAIDESVGGDGILAKRTIARFEDLRGKRVAFQRGLPSEFFLRVMLDYHGMGLDDVDAVDMETAQAGASFIANHLDAAVLWEPWLTKARERTDAHLLASTKDHPALIMDVLAFTKSAVSRAPQDVQAIVNAVLKAIDYWKLHPDRANTLMAPHFQVDKQKYAEILSGLRFCDLSVNRQYFGVEETAGLIFSVTERASSIWLSANTIVAHVKPDSVISSDFVRNAR